MKKMSFNINFSSKFKLFVPVSALLVIGSLALFFVKGLNYGVDFTGGAEIQVRFTKSMDVSQIRDALQTKGMSNMSVQRLGQPQENLFLIKVASKEADLNKASNEVIGILNSSLQDFGPDILKTDIVGPKAGEELRISGFQAMAWALLMIMFYIGLRFDYKYSPGAIVALIHDISIIIGIFVVTQKEFSLQIVGALLAVIGYSVNDTVVVYDRVRENEEANPEVALVNTIDKSLNETLSRTVLTSLTTFFVSATMMTIGTGVIEDFFFAITCGVVVGTYSSLFVAASIVLFFNKNNADQKSRVTVS